MRLAVDDVERGVLVELVGAGEGCGANRRPDSKVRCRGSARAARFITTGSVGLPASRFCAVDMDGHGTGTYRYVPVHTGTYRYLPVPVLI